MKFAAESVIILGLVALTTQDTAKKKGCDCSICQGGVSGNTNFLVEDKSSNEDVGDKPGCSLCERKKELLRMEKEKQENLQKCPFEVLGSMPMKGKASTEIFDQFRELIVPSQNGFFDMMRGIVRTMHVSSEAELKWAKEKEAREMAKKKLQEARKRLEAAKRKKTEKTQAPGEPKVTVVLKQTPCQQFLAAGAPAHDSLYQRFPKKTYEERQLVPNMQFVEDKGYRYHPDLDKNLGNEDLAQPELWASTQAPQGDVGNLGVTLSQESSRDTVSKSPVEALTESPFVKFLSNEEFMKQSGRKDFSGGFGFDLHPGGNAWGAEPQGNFLYSPPQELDPLLNS